MTNLQPVATPNLVLVCVQAKARLLSWRRIARSARVHPAGSVLKTSNTQRAVRTTHHIACTSPLTLRSAFLRYHLGRTCSILLQSSRQQCLSLKAAVVEGLLLC